MPDNGIRSFCGQRTAPRVVLVVAAFLIGAGVTWAQEKTPVPDDAAQAKARELVREVYGKEYEAAKTPSERLALARRLLDAAAGVKGDPANHFVLLRTAKDVAVLAGDAETALEAVGQLVQTFEVDSIQMKVDCLGAVAKAAKSSSQHAALAEQASSLIDAAVAAEDFEAAGKLGGIARDSARRARNYTLVKEIVARLKVIDEAKAGYAEYEKAVARLEESPTDPDANLSAGRYLCLVKGDWEKGIPMLALGSDEALKAVARKDLKGASSAAEQVTLGDGWWELAQTREDGQKEMLLRAGSWYDEAKAGSLSGLALTKVQKRLEEIERFGRPIAEARPRGVRAAGRVKVTADKVVLWNTRNSSHMDRGAVSCNLMLGYRGSTVWFKKGIRMPWNAKTNPSLVVQLPKKVFDTVRVEVIAWHVSGGGLSEIEVFHDEQNIARGRPARASGQMDARFAPSSVTDGIVQENENYVGYWLLPDSSPGWIEIDFSDVARKK